MLFKFYKPFELTAKLVKIKIIIITIKIKHKIFLK